MGSCEDQMAVGILPGLGEQRRRAEFTRTPRHTAGMKLPSGNDVVGAEDVAPIGVPDVPEPDH
jgi:hypothetical protein